MRLFWKALLLAAIPIGGYLLYKKSGNDSPGGVDSEEQTRSSRNKEKEASTAEVVEQLTEIDGVTSRVAENLAERGITSREALLKLSEEELKSIKGIGPKRAAKILNLR